MIKKRTIDIIAALSFFIMIFSAGVLCYMLIVIIFYSKINETTVSCPDNYTIVNFDGSTMAGYILDKNYYSIEKEKVTEIINYDNTNTYYNYITEGFDCDEYGIVMLANILHYNYNCNLENRVAFGILIGRDYHNTSMHLLNFFVDKNLTYWCVEPQDDTIIKCSDKGMNFNFVFV